MNAPRVTVYIPAYNVSQYLAHAIEGVLAQTQPFDEILVIDDGSRDDSADIARRYSQVRLIQHPVNRGLSAARNTAIRAARNEIVASVDADVIPEPTWIAALAPHFEDPKIAGAGGLLTEGVQTTLADRWRRARMGQDWGPAVVRNPLVLYGSNTVYRKSAVLGAGGYDETLRSAGDDTDLDMRLRAAGWELIYDPAAHATHMRHDDLKSIMDMYWRWWKFGNNSYRNGVTFRSWLGHALFVHFRYNFLRPARTDLSQGRLDLFVMDLLALGYLPYRDFRLWLDSKDRKPRRAPQHS